MTDRVASLALGAWLSGCAGCTALLDLDGYSVAPDAGTTERAALLPDAGASLAPGVAVFDHYRFQRGEASFSVAADEGLLANDTAPGVVAGSFATTRGGGIEIAVDGSFVYTPPAAPGAFWGDDGVEYAVLAEPPARARVRLTVAALAFDLAEPSASRTGFSIAAAAAFDGVGTYPQGMDAAGDVNGDGFEDIIIGVPGPVADTNSIFFASGRGAGVVFGKPAAESFSLADLDAESAQGFRIPGNGDDADFDSLGVNVAGVGDVNGDGLDDVIVSQYGFQGDPDTDLESFDPRGASYVIFGKRDGAPVDMASIRAGQGGGFVLLGQADQRLAGYAVSGAGDVNGDALADVLVSTLFTALESDVAGPGSAYVVFGQVGTSPVQLETLTEEGRGFEISGEIEGEGFGYALSGAGDLNGDGLDDVAIGSVNYPSADAQRGRVAVVYGKRDTEPVLIAELAANPERGYLIDGADFGDALYYPRRAGDTNGDGLDDLVIGAPLASLGPSVPDPSAATVDAGADAGPGGDAGPAPEAPPGFGITYVVYGSPSSAPLSLRALEQASPLGFAVGGEAANGYVGNSVAAGDVNADGLADVLFARAPTQFESGAYVLLGAESTPTFDVSTPGEPARVLQIAGAASDGMGIVASADVNADGFDDLLAAAAYYADAPQGAGGIYVSYGWDVSDALGERDGALIGTADDNVFELPDHPILIARGGHGTDTLQLGSRAEPLDLRERGRYESLEVIDARGGGPQLIVLDDAALRRIPQNLPGFSFSLSRRLTILGDADDTLRFDLTGYASRGVNAGRVVYGREGSYYGLEISRELRVEAP